MPSIAINNTSDIVLHPGDFHEGHKLIIKEGGKLPQAPEGLEWRLISCFETLPAQYEYELVRKAAAAAEPKEGDSVVLAKGEKPPQAPEGCKWLLVRILESMPPKYEYELRKVAATGYSSDSSVSSTTTSSVTGANEQQSVKTQPQWGDLTTVRQGAPLPKAPAGFKWSATGRVYETHPMQVEYRLEKKSGPSYVESARDALAATIKKIQTRITEEIRSEDAVRRVSLDDLTGGILVECAATSSHSPDFLAGMRQLMSKHLAAADFGQVNVRVKLLE